MQSQGPIKRLFLAHPRLKLGLLCTSIIAGVGVFDYNRKIPDTILKDFELHQDTSHEFPELLAIVHKQAYLGRLSYNIIHHYRFECPELYFIYKRTERESNWLAKDDYFKDHSVDDLNEHAASNISPLAAKLCRRAMLRNGMVVSWGRSLLRDTIMGPFLVPVIKQLYDTSHT